MSNQLADYDNENLLTYNDRERLAHQLSGLRAALNACPVTGAQSHCRQRSMHWAWSKRCKPGLTRDCIGQRRVPLAALPG
jgi:hypothetical protein